MTTGKITALTRWTFIGKVMSLLFSMLSRFVIDFLPRSKHILISWLQSPFAVILEPKKIKSATVFTASPSICHEVMGCHKLRFFVFCFLFFFNLWWILSYIEMKQPWVYMCSPSQSPLPPPSPPFPSRFSQCTRSECLSHELRFLNVEI